MINRIREILISIKLFTEEEINKLNKNKYVKEIVLKVFNYKGRKKGARQIKIVLQR